ncbi:hypothetical protein TNCV_4504881 [Trichonephila clavipes]|nr:hypothetical protein TNCV_4504881 [Trichonephila clavipes]
MYLEDMFLDNHELQHFCERLCSSSFRLNEKTQHDASARCGSICRTKNKNLRYNGVKTSSQCKSLCKTTSYVYFPKPSTEMCLFILGILIDDKKRNHRIVLVEDYLQDYSLEIMEWSAQSLDLNPLKHIWRYLGKHVGVLV